MFLGFSVYATRVPASSEGLPRDSLESITYCGTMHYVAVTVVYLFCPSNLRLFFRLLQCQNVAPLSSTAGDIIT